MLPAGAPAVRVSDPGGGAAMSAVRTQPSAARTKSVRAADQQGPEPGKSRPPCASATLWGGLG